MDDPSRTSPELHPPEPSDEAPAGGLPPRISRYLVKQVLGVGGFGVVYLAHDEQLQRLVAIKVPHRRLVSRPEDAEPYLTEARTVAGLDHPNIVPVHDVGSTEDCPFFIVSKYIEGSTLARRIEEDRPGVVEAVELTATVAETLHYAHRKGLVHRDIKPGNILLEWRAGDVNPPVPYVADFGQALKEENVGRGPRFAGTPAYMSPEQARGEGHRVDGRSDIFSLGVVFYVLLTTRRPFPAQTRDELLDQIATLEPRPPRQWDDTIPKELERICLKALSKRAADRYTTAKDMADDLRCFLAASTALNPVPMPLPPPMPESKSGMGMGKGVSTDGGSDPVRIVPKGLRSFDAHDADFFLELLPGPRDRDGLPDSIRFWKTRIEEKDADNSFAVGLIYGPSGCGKSSLVKAGLLPRLSENVIAVYVETTAEDTETRVLNGLRKRCPSMPSDLGLKESLAALRLGQGIPTGKKVLIVLDQFEQWLHARTDDDRTELVQALRQCDGGRVQCLVLVRDDFWLAVSRFLAALEVELVQSRNTALVDLFDPRHARKVFAAFGRAFGALPEKPHDTTKDQEAFLDQAIAGLAQDGKIVPVRLALFAEMVKGKPWTPATLKAMGGAEGVGVAFLEETFAASTAPPPHRLHQKAAQGVLRALLPETGTDIKGQMQSRQALLAASGYANRPKDFDALLRILATELRLITPTDPQGAETTIARSASKDDDTALLALRAIGAERYYQLTHDYLVPSLVDWLTRKQRETRRGRAELRLADRAALWNAKPENRQLPSLWEWSKIRLLTDRRNWSAAQQKVMRRAARYYTIRGVLAGLCLTFMGWGSLQAFRYGMAVDVCDRLMSVDLAEVPLVVADVPQNRRWAEPLLRGLFAEAEVLEDDKKQLRASLGLVSVDPKQGGYLCERLLAASRPGEVTAIRRPLVIYAPNAFERFWPVLLDGREDKKRRLRAACALALSEPEDPRWVDVGDDVVRCLAGENILLLRDWAEMLEPVRKYLVPHQARRLTEADAGGFAAYLAMLRAYPEDADAALHAQLDRALPSTAKQEDKEALARQHAQAAVALLYLGRGERGWPLFHQSEDPTCRTYLIHRCASLGVDPAALANRLLGESEKDTSVRQGLLLALGEYSADQRAEVVRGPLMERVLKDYQDHPDPGVHSAAEWLLRRWQMTDRLAKIDQELRKAGPGPVQGKIDKPRWYVNGQGQTFAVIPAPGRFWIGSPRDETGRNSLDEDRHEVRIDYAFAVATKLVTVADFKKCLPDFQHLDKVSRAEDAPISWVNWYDAARYCNWLSEQEKISKDQWCYEPNAKGEYAEGMNVKVNYQSLSGYRLPRETEWEYACRAGTVTAWSYGSDVAMHGHYAWYRLNTSLRIQPVGLLKPNCLGLFDMHGNAMQWCQEVYEEKRQTKGLPAGILRVLRASRFELDAMNSRSASRYRTSEAFTSHSFGICVARTYR